MSSCYNDACCKAFYIPFPWTRECLVKVIEIEDLVTFWRGVDAKVVEVRITTELYLDTCDRCCCQVTCHDDRCSAQKSKRRGGHPFKANRHEMCQPHSV